jgi:hypothetical protein
VPRFDDTSPAKTNSAWGGVLEVEVSFVLYLAQKRPMLVNPELATRALPNPATLVPKGRRLLNTSAGNEKSVMGCGDEKKHVARLEFPPSRPKMDYTQPRFDRIDNRVFCHPPTSQGKALGMWCESLDPPLPLRGSPTCSPALARWRRPGFVYLRLY